MSDLTGVDEAKRELRRAIRSARRHRQAVGEEPIRIAEHVLDIDAVREACSARLPVACYVSRADEPPTGVLRGRLIEHGAQLLAPRVEGDHMAWVAITPETQWASNGWGIEEPLGPAFDGSPAVWVVPGLAVDADGYRLGQGGGYFDRALAHVGDDTLVIAIVFEEEAVSELPREDHDRRVDVVVTPDRVRWLSMPD